MLLEISRPRSAFVLLLSRFYIKRILGAAFTAGTGNQDMRTLMAYWWETTEQCVPPETIVDTLKEAEFQDCTVREWFSGLLRDYRAVKGSDRI